MIKKLLLLFIGIFPLSLFGQSKDWAEYSRYADANKALTVNPTVVFMGNSITDFWVDKDPLFFSMNNFVGRGIKGQTTAKMLSRFRQDVIDLKPKFVVILAGINDIAENNGPISDENILGNIISMVELAKANGIKPILCSILPCDYFSWRPNLKPAERVKRVNGMIKKYADKKYLQYIDYYSDFATPEGAMPRDMAPDHCHPNKSGYIMMERKIVECLHDNFGLKIKYIGSPDAAKN